MKIGRRFNTLTLKEYFFYIANYKKYSDFNTLGLYRSITENQKIDLSQKLELIEYVYQYFGKMFNFLQIKEPQTYFDIITLGKNLTKADANQVWENIKINQQKILVAKRIKHRNFGVYAKQSDFAGFLPRQNRIMLRQKNTIDSPRTPFCTTQMQFKSDKIKNESVVKSERQKKQRKNKNKIIKTALNEQ
jgi:hypothetical protein